MLTKRTALFYRLHLLCQWGFFIAGLAAVAAMCFNKHQWPILIITTIFLVGTIFFCPGESSVEVISQCRKLGLSLRDISTTEPTKLSVRADAIVSHLFGEMREASAKRESAENAFFTAGREAEYPFNTEQALRRVRELGKTLSTARREERKAIATFSMAWHLFTGSYANGGLRILVGSRYTNPENLRHGLPKRS